MIVVEKLNYTEDVYDLTVEQTNCFYANDLLVHNCAEQSLANMETCCLAEVFLPNIESKKELNRVVTLLYRICKHSLALPSHHSETEAIVHKNMRMGIGMSGVLQATEEQRSWLSEVYENLREFDKKYSAKHNFPVSVKLTTVKPSGCRTPDSMIRTTDGNKSTYDLMALAGYNLEDFRNQERVWIVPQDGKILPQVYDENNELQDITKLYVNGVTPVIEVEFEDGSKHKFTENHRLLTNTGWKRVDELTIADEIVSF